MSTCGRYFNMLGLVWALKVLKTSKNAIKNGKKLRDTRKEMYVHVRSYKLSEVYFHSN